MAMSYYYATLEVHTHKLFHGQDQRVLDVKFSMVIVRITKLTSAKFQSYWMVNIAVINS